jgi:hypothetical protein
MRQVDQDLLDASRDGDLVKAKRAIEEGADVNVKDRDDGDAPLHWACRNGHEDIVSLLLKHGARINAQSNNGFTLLHWATENGREAVASLLLENGADPTITDCGGNTPLQHDQKCGQQTCAAVIKDFLQRQDGTNTLPEDIRRTLTCPISGDFMKDPVILFPSGKTFDRESICTWLLRNQTPRCPWTNQPLERHMIYVENRDTRDTLIRYLGEEAYVRYDDSAFRVQYQALWNEPTYQEIAALLYGMNWKQIDWKAAQEMATNANEDAVIAGIKALLLFPGFRKEKNLRKDEQESRVEWKRAEKLGLSLLIDAGNPWAQWIKALLVDLVNGEYECAKSLHRLAAKQGHTLSIYSLGAFCENDERFEEAEYYYEQAAEQGHALAQYNLAMLQDPDIELMIPFLEKAATQDHTESLFYLGRIYICSDAVNKNYGQAKNYFERAAKHGHLEAIQNLVTLLIENGLEPKDKFVKERVNELASEQGHAQPQDSLGDQSIRMRQIQLAQEYKNELVMLAEKQDYTERLFIVGVSYQHDDQFDIAENYFERAAAEGHAGALYNLAMLNEDDYERMLRYLEQAAAEQHPDALYYLGTLYFDSNVVAQDLNRARTYFQRAATQGHTEARSALEHFSKGMEEIGDQVHSLPLPIDIKRILTCPISGNIMKDPVILFPSKKTFDRESICTWLLRNPTPRCPWTNQPLERHMAYTENLDVRDILIRYLGQEAYQRHDDTNFKVQYAALWNTPTYRQITALLYGMNSNHIDWKAAQQMATNENQEDAIVVGFKALLLHPELFSSSRLRKDEGDSRREWERAAILGLSILIDAGNPWAQWLKGLHLDILERDSRSARSLYNLAAEKGQGLAQNSLGLLFQEDEQFDMAQYFYELASHQGHALAQYNLAMLHEGTDFDTMKEYLEQAAAQGHASSLCYLGSLYIDSGVMPQDLKRATVYLERAAKQGHVEARDELVTLFLEHQLVPQDNKVKKQVFERAAEQGCNVLATYELIASLLFGMNQQQIDWAEAQRILKHRIELDPILAGFKALLLHPDIFPDDRLEKSETKCLSTWAGSAIKLGLMAMIDSGNAWAQWLKGMFQEHVERDYDYAKKLYQLAANQGLALGQYSLGKLFYDDEQYHVAEDYYTRAANQGHAEAQYDLAMIYEPDFIAMKPRLEQAASQGHAEALYYLGTAYLDSDVVEQNCETAKEYFDRAVGQGHANARYDLARPFSRLALLLLQ